MPSSLVSRMRMTSGRIESRPWRPWQASRAASRGPTSSRSASPLRRRVFALALRQLGAVGYVVFIAAAVSVMALAYVLGEATEQAGTASGPRLAALLNATFGNLPELIIVVLTIREGLIDVARASIIGSVVGNILLVLGASILLGGLRNGADDVRPAQSSASTRRCSSSPWSRSACPRSSAHLDDTTHDEQASLSYGVAIIMVVLYVAYLVYSFTQPPGRRPRGRWPLGRARLADHAGRSPPS